jgi:hypothetical protein
MGCLGHFKISFRLRKNFFFDFSQFFKNNFPEAIGIPIISYTVEFLSSRRVDRHPIRRGPITFIFFDSSFPGFCPWALGVRHYRYIFPRCRPEFSIDCHQNHVSIPFRSRDFVFDSSPHPINFLVATQFLTSGPAAAS